MSVDEIKLIVVLIVSVVACVYGFYLLYNMPNEIMKNMGREIKEHIEESDREYEKQQEMIKGLRKWLFR